MRPYFVVSVVLLGFVLLSSQASGKEANVSSNLESVVTGNTEFAFDLYAKLKNNPEVKEAGGNLFFSPYSISAALAMTWAGAHTETEKQMAQVLHFNLPQEQLHPAFGAMEKMLNDGGKKGEYRLSVANALWGQKGEGFLKEFLDLTNKYYGAGLREVDFINAAETARQTINAWVEKQTQDRIKDLIKKGVLGRDTVLVLTNAIYFKGDWVNQFDKKNTRNAPFMVTAEEKVEMPLMYLKEKFKYWADDQLQIIELPYKGEHLGMIVLLSKKVGDLAEVEQSLTLNNLNAWLSKLQKQEVVVYLPKFKMTSGLNLVRTLADMGMPSAFSEADFSGINGKKDLFISDVLHKAFVEVNEEGTEAAAATAVVMAKGLERTPVFRADHPFVFMIKDNRSGSILFIGRVVNPARQDR
jgi:serpin B